MIINLYTTTFGWFWWLAIIVEYFVMFNFLILKGYLLTMVLWAMVSKTLTLTVIIINNNNNLTADFELKMLITI